MLEGRRPQPGVVVLVLFFMSVVAPAASMHAVPLRDTIEDTEDALPSRDDYDVAEALGDPEIEQYFLGLGKKDDDRNCDLLHLVDLLNNNHREYDKRSDAFRLKRNNSFRLKRNNSFRLKRNNSFRLRKKKDEEEENEYPAVSTRNTSYRLRRNNSFRLKKRMLPGFYFNLFRHPQEGEPGEMRGIESRHLLDRRSNAFRL